VFKFFIETGLLALCSNPQPGGPGLHIPWRLVAQLYPQAEWLPILVASYDTHGLRWDYSYSPVTTRETDRHEMHIYTAGRSSTKVLSFEIAQRGIQVNGCTTRSACG
jgi:hypothetical protein